MWYVFIFPFSGVRVVMVGYWMRLLCGSGSWLGDVASMGQRVNLVSVCACSQLYRITEVHGFTLICFLFLIKNNTSTTK